jgi:ComF family protein
MVYASPPNRVAPESDLSAPAPKLLHQLVQWILPTPCLGCGEVVWRPQDSLGLCPPCRNSLRRWPSSCDVCAGPLPKAGGDTDRPEGYRCDGCRAKPPPYTRLLATWCYQPPLDETVMALKFRRLDYLGAQLGRAMAAIHSRELGDRELVIPVPLYWTRRLGRGFNQAALIAQPIAEALGVPLSTALKRRRATPHQSRLRRLARHHNLDHAFILRRPESCRGRHILLVDDVTTTAATLTAAAETLQAAGAASIVALAAARTALHKRHIHG